MIENYLLLISRQRAVKFLANGQTCDIIWIGRVRIEMYDGSEITLTDVRHVNIL